MFLITSDKSAPQISYIVFVKIWQMRNSVKQARQDLSSVCWCLLNQYNSIIHCLIQWNILYIGETWYTHPEYKTPLATFKQECQCVGTSKVKTAVSTKNFVLNAFVILYNMMPKCHWRLQGPFGESCETNSHTNTQLKRYTGATTCAKCLWSFPTRWKLNEFLRCFTTQQITFNCEG